MDAEILKALLRDDKFGLLNVEPHIKRPSSNDRLVNSFEEINLFMDEHSREPSKSSDMLELGL